MTHPSRNALALCLALSATAIVSSVHAAQNSPKAPAQSTAAVQEQKVTPSSAVLAKGPMGASVVVDDVLSELQRVPEESRKQIASKPESIRQLVQNLMVRRVLALEAARDGLDKNAITMAAAHIAKDRVLSDARLQALDEQNKPAAAAIDAYAYSMYMANAPKFERPEQYRARHILIANSGADARQKADDLLKQLRAGADFETLAKENSTDPGSASRGGDLGYFGPGRMVRPFEDAVKTMTKPGDLSEVVESQFGFHIIRLEDKRPKGVAPFEDVKGSLVQEAYTALMNESRIQKVESLHKGFDVDAKAIEAFVEKSAK